MRLAVGLLLSLSFFIPPQGLAASTVAKKKVLSKLMIKLQGDLKKIEASIKITQTKIKDSQGIQFLPDLQFMLAEQMIGKARVLYAMKREEHPHVPSNELDFSAEKRVLVEGLEAMETIENRFPKFQSLDRVLFYLAHEYRQLNDKEKAQEVYKHLAEKFPKSPYYIRSLVEIGNYYFDKNNFQEALKHYNLVLLEPASNDHSTAHYKIGHCETYLGNYLQGLLHFEQAIQGPIPSMDDDIDIKKTDFKEEAIVASVWPYAELGDKELRNYGRFLKPIEYYRNLAENIVLYRKALKRLSNRLEIKNRLKEAQEVAAELFLVSDDLKEKVDALEQMYLLGRKAKLKFYPTAVLKAVGDTLWTLKERTRDSELNRYEPLFRDMVARSHKISLQLKRKDDLLGIVAAYQDYLRIYPHSASTIVVLTNMGEAAFIAEDYPTAGHAYFKAGQMLLQSGSGSSKGKELFDSAIQAYNETFKANEHLTMLDRTQARTNYRNLVSAYVKNYPGSSNVPALQFNYAKSLYDEQRFTEAASSLKKYLEQYPNSENSLKAALLFLDSYYLQDDMKALVREGQKLLQTAGLGTSVKQKVTSVIQQAQLKQVRSIAGDFSSKDYADKFLEMAQKSRGSSVAEPALYEAFSSLRAGGDSRMYETGEQYLGQYGSNPRAKEILSAMILNAMSSMDLSRAAGYLEAFGQKYPSERSAQGQLFLAAQIYEQLGQASNAINVHLRMGNKEKALLIASDFGLWNKTAEIAVSVPGLQGIYYQGIALWRLNRRNEALNLLQRALNDHGRNAHEHELAAHAGVMTVETEIEEFRKLGAQEVFSAPLLQKKVTHYQSINRTLQEILSLESPRWTLASLAMTGQLNANFAAFLTQVQPPAGMNVAQFRKIVGTQIANYQKSAKEYFSKCLQVAEDNEIFSSTVQVCRSSGSTPVHESSDSILKKEQSGHNMSLPADLRSKLLKEPRSLEFLGQAFLHFFNKGSYAASQAVLYRMLEIDPQSGAIDANLGTVALFNQDVDGAALFFKTALSKDSHNGKALRGLAGLYKKYQFKKRYQKIMEQVRSSRSPAPPVHPLMRVE